MFSQRHISFFVLLSSGVFAASPASKDIAGYAYGQSIPIRDSLGRLQYIPFPTCNETSLPLALHYGVTETISCTIESLPDELYHLLEYYVHSDAPLTCRVPTIPLDGSNDLSTEYNVVDVSGDSTSNSNGGSGTDNGPPYTPLTIAVQGTLQLSHLHIWTDMNVIMHRLSSVESPRKEEVLSSVGATKKHKQKPPRSAKSPGYIVAGTAYSLPELHAPKKTEKELSDEEEDAAIIENARNPWTAGHGSKVIRGEPLTLKFRVSWVSGADSLGWLDHEYDSPHIHAGESSTILGLLTKLVFFVMAAGIGALFASYWQRVVRRGGGGGPGAWRGEGILGRPMTTANSKTRRGSVSGVTYGNSGRSNGYGGYSPASSVTGSTPANGGGYGYGKKD
ncbi:conserved hypothetical protein [Talaromyces marneffei ATCC 18224]|uniref:Uncharacterized protein n=2 Tax=Talaromyces marneffei TaxID=37727 RepID=B6QD48_TALMQ|nr:conserved hypothetical protein [Talaromyces marneffei ATCC 18224]